MNTSVKAKIRIESAHKLTPLQMGVLFHAMYAPDSAAYFEQLFCRLDGDIDPQQFEQALALLAQRHAIMRTGIVTKGQRDPLQVVLEKVSVPLTVYDWRDRSGDVQETAFQRLLDDDRQEGFNLNRPPLMRFILVRFSEREWRLVWSHHHLLLDGWSVQLLLKDFFQLMTGNRTEAASRPFSDYLTWLEGQSQDAARDFWQSILGDLQTPTPLGIDKPTGAGEKDFAERRYSLKVPELANVASACKVSVGTLLMAGWAVLLGHYARRDDVTFGVTLSGRAIELPGVDNIVGLLINTLPLRLRPEPQRKLADWLAEVQEAQFALQRYSYSALSDIQTCSGVPQGTSLFESLLIIDNFPVGDLRLSEQLPFEMSGIDMYERTHYPLALTMVPKEGEVSLKLGYDRSKIDDATAEKVIGDFELLLNKISDRADATAGEWAECLGSAPLAEVRTGEQHAQPDGQTERFWRDYLHGVEASPVGEESTRTGIHQRVTTKLSSALTQRLSQLAASQQVTVNTLVQSAYAVALARLSGRQEALFGVTLSGRPAELAQSENIAGLFSQTLPIRVDCAPGTDVAAFFEQVQVSQEEIERHADVQPAAIQRWAGFAADRSLYDSVLICADPGTGEASLNADATAEHSHYAFSLYVKPRGTELTLEAVFDPARIDATRANLLLEGTRGMLAQLADGATHVGVLRLTSGAEAQDAVYQDSAVTKTIRQGNAAQQVQEAGLYNTTARQEEADASLPELFRRAAAHAPAQRAVSGADRELSYGQLLAESRNFARRLAGHGVRPGMAVAVCLDRGADMLAALLGVMWAGAEYVPVDPTHPAARRAMILEDAAPQLVVVDAANERAFDGQPTLRYASDWRQLDGELPGDALSPLAPAYTIFTSGSTGRPKGVRVTHGALANILLHFCTSPGLNAADRLLAVTTLSFDIAALELFLPLSCGAEVVIATAAQATGGPLLAELIARHGITVMQATPASWRMLLAAGWRPPEGFRAWCGGEALPLELARDLLATGVQLWNLYGPTETTIWSAETAVTEPLAAPLPVGGPIRRTALYVLDGAGQRLPAGVSGELAVGGAGLSTGYLRDPARTARAFRPDPDGAEPGSRLYLTGDLARERADGRIEVLGRLDHQIKLNGFRIELGEIDAALRALPGVRDAAAAIHRAASGGQLAGYLVAAEDAPEDAVWLASLAEALPRYMLPTALMRLPALPLTANGKIDRKALPQPQIRNTSYVQPRTPEQKTLAAIWQDVLGMEQVGITDNYFSLGGNSILSIRVVTQAAAQGIRLNIEDLFQKLTIERLTESNSAPVQAAEAPRIEAFALLTEEDRRAVPEGAVDGYPLSELQAGMLFHNGADETNRLYHNVVSYLLDNPAMDTDVVRQRMNKLIAVHPVLRTGFSLAGYSRPLQWVYAQAEPLIEEEDLREASEVAQLTLIGRAQQRLREERFDLAKPPLLRLLFQRLDDSRWQVTVALHHVILDGWSLASLLTALLHGEAAEATEPQQIFRDFIHLEQQALHSTRDHTFWQKQLKDLPVTTLPRWPFIAKNAEAAQANYETALPPALYQGLTALAQEKGVPLKSVLLAIHMRVLAHWSGEREVVTGLVTNGRPESAGSAEALGLFLNTLPMRINTGGLTGSELLEAVRQAESAQLPHRRFAMTELRRMLQNRTLFETTFNFVDFHVYNDTVTRGRDRFDPVKVLNAAGSQALDIPLATSFSVDRQQGTLHLILTCDGTLFPASQVEAMGASYLLAAEALLEGAEKICDSMALISAEERDEIAQRSCGASDVSQPVLQAFQAIVERHPQALAVVSADGEMDYATLDRRANELAAQMQRAGLRPDVPVALLFERSPDLVVAMLAAMKTACPYVPLAPYLPQGRLAEILADVRPQATLTVQALQHILPVASDAGHLFALDALPETPYPLPALPQAHPATLAYLLFTSGSTGRPKGIGIPTGALANHMAWMQRRFPLAPGDRVLQKTPVGFDASVWEFWAPLMAGATLVLPADGVQNDAIAMLEAVQRHAITVLQLVPGVLDIVTRLPELAACTSLQRVFVGGEALQASTVERFNDVLGVPLINLYGPTETTIDTTFACYGGDVGEVVSIGEPIDGVSVYVLDQYMQPAGVGIYGELWIGGAGVARGYWNRASETAASFRPDPFSTQPGERMFRTRDVVRWLPEGGLQYAGRSDSQIKLRGNRIELADIEAVLARQPGVTRSAVRVCVEKPGQLVAWVMGPAAQEAASLIAALRHHLPDYMLPQRIVAVTSWPLTPNGKTDYAALTKLAAVTEPASAVVAPESEIESELVAIWQKLLPHLTLGVTENFFEVGGDSILAMQIAAEMRRKGWAMTPRHLFEQPTIRELAAVIVPAHNEQQSDYTAPVGLLPLSPVQRWFFELELSDRAHWNQAVMLRVPQHIQPHRLQKALERLVSLHEAFRLRFVQKETSWFARLEENAGDWYSSLNVSDLSAAAYQKVTDSLVETTQRSLDLEQGPLFKAVHLDKGLEVEGRLLLVIHHLIVDGVSWRILLNEINLLLDGVELATPAPGFGGWLALQEKYEMPQAVLDYWLAQATKSAEEFRAPSFIQPQHSGHYSQVRTIEKSFGNPIAQRLTDHSQLHLKARPLELLLTSVLCAMGRWAHEDRIALTLEGHGRDNAGDWVLERTPGWFTVLYPVMFDLKDTDSEMTVLQTVKKTLREVPDGGYGYGQLRDTEQLPPVSFNYLGQFEESDERGLTVVDEAVGDNEDPQGKRPFPLEIVAFIRAGKLTLRCVFDDRVPEAANITAMLDSAADWLQKMLACEDVSAAWTLHDFPLADVEERGLAVALGDAGNHLADLWKATPTQQGMLFHSRLENGTSEVYLEQIVMRLHEEMDADLLAQAWNRVINRHDALRVSFVWEDLDHPQQRVWRSVQVPFETVDLQGNAAELEAFMAADRQRGIDLSVAPMMRVSLLRKQGKPWRLVWLHHHALLDGWSMALIFNDLAECYRALKLNQRWPTNSAPSYATYLRWLQQQGATQETAERFWREYFQGLELASPVGEESTRTGIHQRVTTKLSSALTQRLSQLAASQQVTVNTLVQSAYAVALARLSGRQEALFGVTLSGRPAELAQSENIVGLFIQTLPMRVNCAPGTAVATLAAGVQALQGEIERHAHVQPADIQRWSGFAAGQPLFDSALIYENYPLGQGLVEASDSLNADVTEVLDHPHYAFSLYVKPRGTELTLEAVFDPARVDATRANLLLEGTRGMLAQLADGATHVGALRLTSGAEAQGAVSHHTAARQEKADASLPELFRRAAAHAPAQRAVSGADRELSYGQLLAESRNFARRLAGHGVRPGMAVAVCLDRGADMLAALLGVMWAGAEYVPVDPTHPAARRAMILEDAAPQLVVVDAANERAFDGQPTLRYASDWRQLDGELPGDALSPLAPAYTIFTSGSTGRPKGVRVTHGALANILLHFCTSPGLNAADRLLAVTTLSFDIAALELFLPLSCGAEVVIATAAQATGGPLLAELIARHGITVMQATPASWRMLLAAGWRPPEGFRAWCGGEALPLELARDLLATGVQLWNLYGPTETTIWSAETEVTEPLAAPLPVGGPIRQTALYVLDGAGQRLPAGVSGELAVGGAGLSTGYLRDPARTARAFRPDPDGAEPGSRLYLTGDLARERADGRIEVLGRLDHQIKLNGFRIELGEIDAALRALPGVRDAAAAIHRAASGGQLAGYLVAAEDAPEDAVWLASLAEALPRYMLPTALVRLPALPLTANGKIDRKALADIEVTNRSASFLPPEGPVETAVCAIWQTVFSLEQVGVEDDFYALGGHSLMATQIHTRIVRIFRISPPLGEVFRATTPRELAAVIYAHADKDRASQMAEAYLRLRAMTPEQRQALRNEGTLITGGSA
ncbi:amino acid adenylation domain-containing protein [Erwinia sp. BNK-24-b]|uniref:amino acid adenylation domain-containing protein n=1 Tax=unclassified Erwinia TaxID=2622719 RepID=UPI0039BFD90D